MKTVLPSLKNWDMRRLGIGKVTPVIVFIFERETRPDRRLPPAGARLLADPDDTLRRRTYL